MSDAHVPASGPGLFLIYARAANGVIGLNGDLPWHIPADLKRFKRLTDGRPIIMGRKTFQSLPGLLPSRRHIVLSRREGWDWEGAELAHDTQEAVAMAAHDNAAGEAAVIGGAAIFDVLEPLANRLELTQIHADYPGDVFMPEPRPWWREVAREDHEGEGKHPAFSFITYKRISREEVAR